MTQNVHFQNLAQYGFGPNVMKKTKICTKCGRITKTGILFCRRCAVLSALRNENAA